MDESDRFRIGAAERRRFQALQTLEDAIAYRGIRLAAPCIDCGPGNRKCDDHACDVNLIGWYRQQARAVTIDLTQSMAQTLADPDRAAPNGELRQRS